MEKEFIDQRIANLASKRINDNLDRCTQEVRIIGLIKRKKILGSFFKTVERDDNDLLKVINKRVKLEQKRIENQNQQKIQAEALVTEQEEPSDIAEENVTG
jgi:hypothetical protein